MTADILARASRTFDIASRAAHGVMVALPNAHAIFRATTVEEETRSNHSAATVKL